jgi:hypothetical protein
MAILIFPFFIPNRLATSFRNVVSNFHFSMAIRGLHLH